LRRNIRRTPPDLLVLKDRNSVYQAVNPSFCQFLGRKTEEIIGKTDFNLFPYNEAEMYRRDDVKVMESGRPQIQDEEVTGPEGKKWLQVAKTPVYDNAGAIIGILCLVRDVTERKYIEEVLRLSEEKYRRLIETASDAIFIADASTGVIIDVNRRAEELLGLPSEKIIGMHQTHLHPKEEAERYQKMFIEHARSEGTITEDLFVCHKDGRKIPVEISASVTEVGGKKIVQGIFRDITERKKMEGELLRAQKIESLGILAGGIAHDFNNILTGILGNITLAKAHAKPGDRVIDRLSEAEKACLQAKDLTQQLLTFSRGGVPVKKTVSITELLKDSATFVLRGSGVQCEFSIPDDLWLVEVDEGQINQVISNLIINAVQAMPEGGTIKVQAENIVVWTKDIPSLKDGRYLKISIKDQGIGIQEKHLHRIFDPYFTTKHRGSGLGLAVAYSIIKKHYGYIDVKSQLGVGTTFFIYLPASEHNITTNEKKVDKIFKGAGRILLMDDEDVVRHVVGEMLKHLGYNVEFAKDGAEAIKLYEIAKERGKPFDAVVMDLTVPGGIGGKEAINKLLEIDPDVKAVVSSGYSNDPVLSNYTEYGFRGVVAKPYKLEELSKTLHEIILGGGE
jgi:two-component system cell cycle sensor histidine kinase/response regulator CckA